MSVEELHERRTPWIRLLSEFIVIVIGVLVALAVDQWASDRNDRASELEYLLALRVDLRGDSTMFADALVPIAVRADSVMVEIAPVVRGQAPVPLDTLGFLRGVVQSTGSFTRLGEHTTFDELLATGSLRLIESSSLRSSLVSYYASKDYLEDVTAYRASGYPDVVRSHLPGDPFLAGPSDAAIRSFGVRDAIEAIRSEEFLGAMNRHGNYLEFMRPRLEAFGLTTDALLLEVTRELEARR